MSVTSWVRGDVTQTGKSFDASGAPLVYFNHCCGLCGGNDTPGLCGQTYYVNTTNGVNPNHSKPYSKRDIILHYQMCVTSTSLQKGSCPDYKLCPIIGGIAPQVQWSPASQSTTDNPKSVACLYPLSTFTELSYVQQFINAFPGQEKDSKSDYNQLILPSFCLTPTRACPTDPITLLPMPYCSRFVTTDTKDPCYGYLGRVDPDDADLTMAKYCAIHNTPDCLCINRLSNPVYQIMAVGNSFQNDKCWWKPCQDESATPVSYLVPFNMDDCPSEDIQQCQNIGIVIGGQSTNQTINPDLYTDCKVYGNDDNGGGSDDGGDGSDLWSKWWWLIIAAVVIIIVIVVIIILLV